MLYSKNTQRMPQAIHRIPTLTGWEEREISLYQIDMLPVDPKEARRIIEDDLLDEGNSRQNLATFCQTYMEEDAETLMAKTLSKNAIDKSEYPRTSELENRCVNIVANLWNIPQKADFIGTSTVGSSEACMLGGMAMKFRWRSKAQALGIDINRKKPNLVISSAYQVCWEKFCVYWDIELRQIPVVEDCARLDIDQVAAAIDEYTIGVVGILGITYTGMYDDIQALDQTIEEYNKTASITVPIHVDAASGGLYAPFIQPDLVWDFRLKNVVSINTSGHKYGLVYPGVGWVVWKDKKYLPEELIFKVSYLGGEMPTMAINFSRNAGPIVGQYFNFLRLGRTGYTEIHQQTSQVAQLLAKEIRATGLFELHGDASQLPVVCYSLKNPKSVPWDLYQLSDRLQMKGWQVPVYPLPEKISSTVVHRYVCRQDFRINLAMDFIEDFHAAISTLGDTSLRTGNPKQGFTH